MRWPVSQALSRTSIATCLKQSSQERCGPYLFASTLLFYLVLLQMGFTVPQLLPVARCPLTPLFHPYRITRKLSGGLLSAALAVGSRLTGVTSHLAQWFLLLWQGTNIHPHAPPMLNNPLMLKCSVNCRSQLLRIRFIITWEMMYNSPIRTN